MCNEKSEFHPILDLLSEDLYSAVVTHGKGNLLQRCKSVMIWHKELLKGQLPYLFEWPQNKQYQEIINALESDGAYKRCLNNKELTDDYCLSILRFLNGEIESLCFSKKSEINKFGKSKENKTKKTKTTKAHHNNDGANYLATSGAAKINHEISALLKYYAIERKIGFDLSQGILKKQQWKQVLKYHKTIKSSKWLKNIIMQLGRKHSFKAKASQLGKTSFKKSIKTRHISNVHSSCAPMQMSGIERNDDVARMLPSELSMLSHKKLKMLWHLRRAERLLLSYQVDGVLSDHVPLQENVYTEKNEKSTLDDFQQGPVIIILDSSASMRGWPEHLAKSIVLETLRVCQKQYRLCYLFLFSGPNNIKEILLDSSKSAWQDVLELMQYSFHGGTQVEPVFERALALLKKKEWQDADILLLSDGRFNISNDILKHLKYQQYLTGVRCSAINVGSWQKTVMHTFCDKVYDFSKNIFTSI